MVINMVYNLAILALASRFMVFSASAATPSDGDVTFYSDLSCSQSGTNYPVNLLEEPCSRICKELLPYPPTYQSVSITDSQLETTCYFWFSAGCLGERYQFFAREPGCSPVTPGLFMGSVMCFRGTCGSE